MNKKGFEMINPLPILLLICLIGITVGVGLIIIDKMLPDSLAQSICTDEYQGVYEGNMICKVPNCFIGKNLTDELLEVSALS